MAAKAAGKAKAKAAAAPPRRSGGGAAAAAAGGAGSSGDAAPLGGAAAPGADPSASIGDNTAVLARMQENVEIILHTVPFKDVKEACALQVQDGGLLAPFKKDFWKLAIERGDTYLCGINMWWLDMKYMAMPGVPIQGRVIDELADHFFSHTAKEAAAKLPALTVATSTGSDPLAHKGSLERVSPPEPVYAFLEAVRRLIDQKAEKKVLAEWRRLMLSWAATCLRLKGECTLLFRGVGSYHDVD